MNPIQLNEVRGTESGIKTATVDINGFKLNLAVAHGIKNAMDLLAKIQAKEPGFENIHFLEVMACPGGCLGGSNTINSYRQAVKQLTEYVNSSKDVKEVVKD